MTLCVCQGLLKMIYDWTYVNQIASSYQKRQASAIFIENDFKTNIHIIKAISEVVIVLEITWLWYKVCHKIIAWINAMPSTD